jgi:hypothetical protein
VDGSFPLDEDDTAHGVPQALATAFNEAVNEALKQVKPEPITTEEIPTASAVEVSVLLNELQH